MYLTEISNEIVIKGKITRHSAWDLITDFTNFTKQIDPIERITVLEKNQNEGKSEWHINIEGAPLSWVAKDYYDKENYQFKFKSICGDFEKILGRWKIENFKNIGIKIFFDIKYRLGIPVLEEHVGPILKNKIKTFMSSILNYIKTKLLNLQQEERKSERINIGKFFPITLNDTPVRAFILNISKKGIMFEYDEKLNFYHLSLKIGNIFIQYGKLSHELKSRNYRIVFKNPINPTDFNNLINILQKQIIYDNKNGIKKYSVLMSKTAKKTSDIKI
jgi:ribosome-associated toxin RatA of RatAB toxin-antitoxin module